MRLALQNTKKKRTKLFCNKGRKSRLEKWKEKLIPWIEAEQNEGKTVSVRHAAVRAKQLDKGLS